MNDVMIDIETLDVKSTAMILSIGVDAGQFGSFYYEINPHQQVGRTIDSSTLVWWINQGNPPVNGKEELAVVLNQLTTIFPREIGLHRFWSKGSFDFDILDHAYASFALNPPWTFRDKFDYRTVSKLFPQIVPEENKNKHNALADATNQREHLMRILAHIANL